MPLIQIKQQKTDLLDNSLQQNCSSSQHDENLSSDGNSNNIFVALYDFQGIGDEKLYLRKGDQVYLFIFLKFISFKFR
jgi:hypothetical protein